MKKVTYNEKDNSETSELAGLIRKIDTLDAQYVNRICEEIFKHQPFFLTVLLGYRADVSPQELEEIMKIYFLIWEENPKNPEKRFIQIHCRISNLNPCGQLCSSDIITDQY